MTLKLIRRADSPNWWVRGTVRGISIFESTKIADRDVAETIRIIRERDLLEESIFGKKVSVTFRQAADAYLKGGGSPRFLTKLNEALGDKVLRKINQNDLDLAARRLYFKAAPATLNRQFYTPFIAVWNYAAENDWAEIRRWRRTRKATGTVHRRLQGRSGSKPVDYELAATFVSNMSPAPAMVMTALFYTGMRPIELFTLEATEVNVDKRWITLLRTKTGEPRGVPMHEFLVPLFEALIKRRDKYPQVFRSFRGKPYKTAAQYGGQLSNTIVATRKRLLVKGQAISDVSPYTARHSVSTQLVINGVHPHIKDQILGHASDSMSRHYTNVPQAPLIEAINTLAVPERWRGLEWWSDPVASASMLIKWGKADAKGD